MRTIFSFRHPTKDLGKAVAGQIETSANEYRKLKLKCEGMSDKDLLRSVHNESWLANLEEKESPLVF